MKSSPTYASPAQLQGENTLRILVVSDLPQFVTGGAEAHSERLIRALLEKGHEVICLGRRMGKEPVVIGGHRLRVHRIYSAGSLGRFVRGITYVLSLALLLIGYRRWADAIYTQFLGEAAVTAALLKRIRVLRIPLVASPAGTGPIGDLHYLQSIPFSPWLVRTLDRHCDRINLIAERMKDELMHAGFSGRNFSYIPNGIRVAERRLRHPPAPPTFVVVARLVELKGHDVLLDALARIVDKLGESRIRIIGDGPKRSSLAVLADQLRVAEKIDWLGELSEDEVFAELERAHVFILPSFFEGMANAALEAMERGLAVILTDCGGIDRYVGPESGWVVPTGNDVLLAEAICNAIDCGVEKLRQKGENCRALVERHFDIEVVADRYLALFRATRTAP